MAVPIIVAGMTWDWLLNPEFGIINYMLTNMHVISQPIKFSRGFQVCHGNGYFCKYMEKVFLTTPSPFCQPCSPSPEICPRRLPLTGQACSNGFFKVTLPQLRSVSLVIVFIHIIWTAINFDFIWVMTEGGPNYATETLPLMIYRYSMKKFDVGAASALSTMMFTVMVVLFIFYYRKRSSLSDDMA